MPWFGTPLLDIPTDMVKNLGEHGGETEHSKNLDVGKGFLDIPICIFPRLAMILSEILGGGKLYREI
jgi:hypothetical protein